MQCLWCNIFLGNWHATKRMISHVTKWRKGGLGPFTVIIPKESDKWYQVSKTKQLKELGKMSR